MKKIINFARIVEANLKKQLKNNPETYLKNN